MAESSLRLTLALTFGMLLAIPVALLAFLFGLATRQSVSAALVTAGNAAIVVVDQLLTIA